MSAKDQVALLAKIMEEVTVALAEQVDLLEARVAALEAKQPTDPLNKG